MTQQELESYFEFRPLPEVEVWWWDITTELGWCANDEANRKVMPKPVKSVGFLLHEDDFKLVLVSCTNHTEVADRTAIPKGCVQKILRHKPAA